MATKKKIKRGKNRDGGVTKIDAVAVEVLKEQLDKFGVEHYRRYGNSVLEDRAIPDYRDGMNPVNRRILWSAYDMCINSKSKAVKAARIVGDVLGRFHPHGDSAAYSAMVGMTNNEGTINNICVGLIEGEGNWGSLSNPSAAAMRYTEARLSKFSDEVIFNKFYTPVVDLVPNYDSQGTEPLVLPVLLPILFLNGRFGIAPGATANIPSFDGNSVLDLLKAVYEGEEITPKLLSKTLTVVSTYGGREKREKTEGRKLLFTTTRGSVTLYSHHEWDPKKRQLHFTRFANCRIAKAIEKIGEFKGVQSVQDLSDTKDVYGRLTVTFKKLTDKETQRLIDKCVAYMSSTENYVLNFTRRTKDELGQAQATMKAMNLVKAFKLWVKWRTNLEKKACSYWIAQDEREIHRLTLLIQAVDLIDFITSLLKDKRLKNNDDVYQAYAKKAKVSIDDAKYVMGRPIISLRNLEKQGLIDQRSKVEANKAKLEKRRAKPHKFMAKQLEDFRPYFKHQLVK